VITPRYVSYDESKISARSGAAWSPRGGGTSFTSASRIWSTPSPVLAEARMMWSRVIPVTSVIWAATTSGWAASMSILLTTGMICRSASTAW
jgi:hypothetical protein